MGYMRMGTGAKTLLWIPDPSHNGDLAASGGAAKSMWLATMGKVFRPFVEDGYSVFLVGHKPDLPHGCTVADMAEDYAGLIVDEFAGKVDLLVADSAGGMIGFCLAARHPNLFGHIATIVAGYTMTDEAKAANLESARLLSAGRKTDAAETMVTFMYPKIPGRCVTRLFASVVARVSFPASYNPTDILVAAEALGAFDGREILPTIPVPVLLVCGDRDRSAPKEVCEQTADLIPDCTVELYEGKDHLGTILDKRLHRDVLEFTRRTRTPASERDASRA
jgi:pimeloyl-ACP methyl ester carboxylesterase